MSSTSASRKRSCLGQLVLPLLVAVVGSFMTMAVRFPAQALQAGMTFRPSGLDGAGFQNVVAIDPRGTGLVLSGGDVAGIQRSTDWGQTWQTSNLGMANLNQFKVAALAFSATNPDKIYAAVGHKGVGGGLLVSTDAGRSWTMGSTTPQFAGGNNGDVAGLPDTHPRSTGNLIAVDGAGGFLYAATFDDGVMRSADDGRTWTTLGLAGVHLRSLVLDPDNPNTLYASSYGAQAYKTTSARTTGSFSRLAASPATVEELVVVGGRLYAAAGAAGVFTSGDGGASWTRIGTADLRTDGPVWLSISAYRDGVSGKDVIIAGSDHPTKVATGNFQSLMRSTDGGTTWTSLTDPSRIHFTTGGPGGNTWWLSRSQPSMMLGMGSYTAAHIVTNPSNRARIFVAGRSGVWATTDNGANWYPMVGGMGVTINRQVIADPNVPGRVFVANTDWVVLASGDGLATVSQTRPPSGNMGLSLALDTASTPSVLYAGVGERDTNTLGEIYSSADPSSGWSKEGLAAVAGGKRPLGVAVRRVNGSPVLLAAVDGGGIWRKAGGAWSQVSTAAMGPQGTEAASFSWVPNSATVYLYDRATGVWRSNDNGASWVRIWQKPSAQEMTGYVVADPADASRLYVSVLNDGVYRLDNATTGTVGAGITAVELGSFSKPGPIALAASGRLLVATGATGTTAATLSASDDRGATWSVVSDSVYSGAALFPFQLSTGPQGAVYLALNGTGAIAGGGSSSPAPDTTAPTAAVSSPTPNQVYSGLSVPLSGTATDDRSVSAVRVAVMNRTTNTWLQSDGTWGPWQQQDATLAAPGTSSTSWNRTFNATEAGLYSVQVESLDPAGNASPRTSVPFEVRTPDTASPVVTVGAPAWDQVLTKSAVVASGTATDNLAVSTVRIAVQDRTANTWLHSDGTWGRWAQLSATLASPGAGSTGWTYGFNVPKSGLYGVQVESVDSAGNVSTQTWVRFEVKAPKHKSSAAGVMGATLNWPGGDGPGVRTGFGMVLMAIGTVCRQAWRRRRALR
jgi:hypothetical protein